MQLSAGDKLGPYEIAAPIGKGGMGEVFRARDSRLNRDVAIKVSAERFSERFEREARAIAALNHPNICHLYDVGPDYLVMELVEGPTLAERLKPGAIPLEESLNIARQIADALEAAHDKGITHRDLKPGNVKIKADGTVKVLDFGLAKMGGTPAVPSDASPTLTMGQTEAGMILGTASYMSPEQAKGKPVDQRADIYSFGVVLYEMVTGERLHNGESTTEVLASVIKEEPKWERVPAQVRKLLRLCLEKDPQKRLRHIANAMALVEEAPSGTEVPRRLKPAPPRWMWIAASLFVIIAAGVAVWAPWRAASPAQELRFTIPVPDKFTFNPGTAATLSPDGKWLAFPAIGPDNVSRMYIRSLSSLEVRPLEGSEVGPISAPPFWSSDSKFVVYYAGNASGGKLKKNDIAGGPPQIITDARGEQGGSWNRDNVILDSSYGAIVRVNAAGGAATPLTSGSGNPGTAPSGEETRDFWPQFLPDGRHFLYLHVSAKPGVTGVYVGSIDAKPEQQSSKPLLLSNRQAFYAPAQDGGTGWLLFEREGSIMAQRFDPDKLQLSGDPAPVAGPVGSFSQVYYAMFSASDTGVLLYRGGGSGGFQLIWIDSQGRPDGTLGEPGLYVWPSISPDGKRVAVSQTSQGNQDIWVWDIARETSLRLTFDAAVDNYPVWFPDGRKIVFASNRAGHFDLYAHAADGTGEDQLLLKSEEDKFPRGFSADGKYLVYDSQNPKTLSDVWILPLESSAKPVLFQGKEYLEALGQFSPDRRWIAYTSNESGTTEVYVRPFVADSITAGAESGGKWEISRGGGIGPKWRGKQLIYMTPDGRVMAVDVSADKTIQPGTPKVLFQAPLPPSTQLGPGDITSDGKRFLYVATQGTSGTPPPFTVVTNWQASLKK